MRIDRPARPGDTLQVCVGFVDVPKGIYKLNEVDFFASTSLSSASLSSADIDDAEDEAVNGASLPNSDGMQDSEADAMVADAGSRAEPLVPAAPASKQ